MNVNEYRSVLHEDISLAANANYSNPADEFLLYVTSILSNADEFDDYIECYYEGVSRRKANMRIDGYAMDDADESCCVFISDYRGPYEDDSIRKEDIDSFFNKVRHFVEESIKHELFLEIEESTMAYEFSRQLYYERENITKFRFYLITDAFNKQRNKNIKDTEIDGKTVELNVWDISRIFDVVSSQTQKESVEITFSDYGCEGVPCVKAVQYSDVIADIEIIPKFEDDLEENDQDKKPDNIITYESYLAVVPGQVLADLYLEYGSRLLEGNVRSFLSVKGKVNKSIQNTIKNYPEMFFAYNNGIAATATDIETQMTENGLVITGIKNLQIVNGGQTTASIANAIINKRKDEEVDVTNLYVPMKVSVLEHAMAERIIPKISEYSNSQNKVDASDFFSNHPFHIRIEDYSRKTPAPAINGNQYQQYWYYERTRGQYNQGKMKFKPKSSQLKQYETRYPESQVIKMVDFAKYMEIYYGAPDIVSKGKQEIVKTFSKQIKDQWTKSDSEFNLYYFKRAVALAIMFNATDEIIKRTRWYKEKHSYKANVAAYTMSIIFHYIKNHARGFDLDFIRIWNQQGIYQELADQISTLCTEVYEFITDDNRPVENVTQWCKQSKCWENAKSHKWTFNSGFLSSLVSCDAIKSEEQAAKENRKVDNEIDDVKLVMALGSEYWTNVLSWAMSRRLISEIEQSVIKMAININYTGRVPSVKQTKIILKARDRLIAEGMPLQF